MRPPTEQFIRDYMNRLSVAARGRLSRKDRRALMDRTRADIEHSTGSGATVLEVAGVLSRLGAPANVVAHEVQRLAETRGDAGESPPEPRISRLARVGRRELGRLRASWQRRVRPGNFAGLRAVLTGRRAGAARAADTQTAGPLDPAPVSGLEALGLVGPRPGDTGDAQGAPSNAGPGGSTRPRWPHRPARRDVAGRSQARQDAQDQAAVEAEDQAAVEGAETDELAVSGAVGVVSEPAEGPVVAGPTSEALPIAGQSDARDGATLDREAAELARGAGYPGEGVAGQDDAGAVAAGTGPKRELTDEDVTDEDVTDVDLTALDLDALDLEATGPQRVLWIRRASAAVVGWTRDKTLESVATILLGLGGAIYPPVWLLGAMVALASKVWDYRDKWVGLAVPIVLTIVGTAAGLILTGSQSSLGHDLHVGWVSADVASRVSAVLGAIYLAWRSVHGRRPVPPWTKPHRVG